MVESTWGAIALNVCLPRSAWLWTSHKVGLLFWNKDNRDRAVVGAHNFWKLVRVVEPLGGDGMILSEGGENRRAIS